MSMTDSTATTGSPTDDVRALANEIAYSLRTEGVFHLYQEKGEIILAALRTATVAGRDRETLRKLVDIVWNEATESTAVPSTKWADKLIDKALAFSQPAETPLPRDHYIAEAIAEAGEDYGDLPSAYVEANRRPHAETPAAIAEVRETVDGARVHFLKTWPQYFEAILSGKKTFEWRIDDRDFHVGDTLVLQEYVPNPENPDGGEGHYTGRDITRKVTYLFGCWPTNKRTVVMSLSTLPAPVPAGMREALRPFVETMSRMTAAKMIDPTLGPFTPIEVTVTKHQFFTARAALALPAGRVDRDQRSSEEDWRSIETAPKSVVPILLTDARIQDFTAVCWYEVDESYPWQTYDGIGYHETRFTHWKPLPAPPSQSTAQGREG